MSERALVTGGAGFIGRHVCSELLRRGYEVRAYDALSPQVHGYEMAVSDPDVELRVADVRDPYRLANALAGVDVVVHLAAAVGVGQSMYEPQHYVDVNVNGTAILMGLLTGDEQVTQVRKLVVASSMSVYGEGEPAVESQPVDPRSVYALTKYDQEQLCLLLGRAYELPTTALRFFNTYGPGQALANPYTGVMAIFAAQLLNGNRPLVYEDGKQTRDFVHVDDVARAVCAALLAGEHPADYEAINVGTGRAVEIGALAATLADAMDRPLLPRITGEKRVGDVRHCVADRSKATRLLGWRPEVGLADGLRRQVEWLAGQHAPDNVDGAHAELAARNLLR